jgi:hypothetical protein
VEQEWSALELRARLALAVAPNLTLAEGALTKALGRVSKTEREALLAKLESAKAVTIEAARRGRRIRLTDAALRDFAHARVPARARFTGAVVNALVARLAPPAPPKPPLRERILTAHAALGRGPGGTAELASLREALDGADRADVDRTLLDLEREGVIALGRVVDLGALDDRTRAAAIDDPERGLLVYVSKTSVTEPVS